MPAAREQAGSSQRAPASRRQSCAVAGSAGKGPPASLSISVPEQSQFCRRRIPRALPTETSRQHPRKLLRQHVLAAWRWDGHSDASALPVNSSGSPPFAWFFHRSVKQLISETTNLPWPVPLRSGNETFPPDRGEKPEGTCNREAGNKRHGSVSWARLKVIPCQPSAKRPPDPRQRGAGSPRAAGEAGAAPPLAGGRATPKYPRVEPRLPPVTLVGMKRGGWPRSRARCPRRGAGARPCGG